MAMIGPVFGICQQLKGLCAVGLPLLGLPLSQGTRAGRARFLSSRFSSSVTVHGQLLSVIPAQAGIQGAGVKSCRSLLDSRLRGNDDGHGALPGKRTGLYPCEGLRKAFTLWDFRCSPSR